MKKYWVHALAVLSVFNFASNAVAEECGHNEDARFERPFEVIPPTTPANVRAFYGKWTGGEWGQTGLCTALRVWKVEPNGAVEITYYSGANQKWRAWRWTAVGKVIDNVLEVTSNAGDKIRYTIEGNSLKGNFQFGGSSGPPVSTTLKRATLPN